MIGTTRSTPFEKFDVSRKEILIVAALLSLVGAIALVVTWIRSGALIAPSAINIVETVNTGSPAGSISHISVKDVTSYTGTVSWVATMTGSTRIQYGTREDQLGYAKDAGSRVSQIMLTNLFPRTRYFFRIIAGSASGPIISDIYSFITTK